MDSKSVLSRVGWTSGWRDGLQETSTVGVCLCPDFIAAVTSGEHT